VGCTGFTAKEEKKSWGGGHSQQQDHVGHDGPGQHVRCTATQQGGAEAGALGSPSTQVS
jgi:hypothetical protein